MKRQRSHIIYRSHARYFEFSALNLIVSKSRCVAVTSIQPAKSYHLDLLLHEYMYMFCKENGSV